MKYKYYASEIDKYTIKVTQANFPNTIQLGDVTDVADDLEYAKIDKAKIKDRYPVVVKTKTRHSMSYRRQ